MIRLQIFVRKYGTYWIKGKGKQKEECNDYMRNDELENDNQSMNLLAHNIRQLTEIKGFLISQF